MERSFSKHLVVTGYSGGSGKTRFAKAVQDLFGGLYKFSVSYTTRQPRENEKNGIDYVFVSVEEFKALIDDHFFIEWNSPTEGIFYGTPKFDIDGSQKMILDIDCFGVQKLLTSVGESQRKKFFTIALLPLVQTRMDWMFKRDPKIGIDKISARLGYSEEKEMPFFMSNTDLFDEMVYRYGSDNHSDVPKMDFLANKIANLIHSD